MDEHVASLSFTSIGDDKYQTTYMQINLSNYTSRQYLCCKYWHAMWKNYPDVTF